MQECVPSCPLFLTSSCCCARRVCQATSTLQYGLDFLQHPFHDPVLSSPPMRAVLASLITPLRSTCSGPPHPITSPQPPCILSPASSASLCPWPLYKATSTNTSRCTGFRGRPTCPIPSLLPRLSAWIRPHPILISRAQPEGSAGNVPRGRPRSPWASQQDWMLLRLSIALALTRPAWVLFLVRISSCMCYAWCST